jgi:hypothetical protein
MRHLIILVAAASLGWFGYTNYQSRFHRQSIVDTDVSPPWTGVDTLRNSGAILSAFKCVGRTHFVRTTSCGEATFVLQNCASTKLDGNNGGIPCEKQWCE